MALSLPDVTVVGTLTADPELHFTQTGTAVANFSIACNTRKREGDRWVDGDTTFLRASIWREYAENVAESLSKGDKVIAHGQLKQRSYEKDGQTRTTFELDADEIGPSLRFATAKVNRVQRSGGGGGQASAAASNGGGWGDDEPGWG
jgi:single-strand DNA-binding protein